MFNLVPISKKKMFNLVCREKLNQECMFVRGLL
jgi:hypothetical protein